MGFEFYTPAGAAVDLGVDKSAVWYWIKHKRMEAFDVKCGGDRNSYVIPVDAVE